MLEFRQQVPTSSRWKTLGLYRENGKEHGNYHIKGIKQGLYWGVVNGVVGIMGKQKLAQAVAVKSGILMRGFWEVTMLHEHPSLRHLCGEDPSKQGSCRT